MQVSAYNDLVLVRTDTTAIAERTHALLRDIKRAANYQPDRNYAV